jgi:regulatory protein
VLSVVTELKVVRGGRVALHIDDSYLCTVSQTFVARWRLFPGREFDEESLGAMRAAALAERAVTDAYRFLEQRARSRFEIETRLRAKGHGDDVVAGVLERLAVAGLLDDDDFARRYVADKRGLCGWGAVRTRRGLVGLGVSVDIIDEVLARDMPGGDEAEIERALRLLDQKGAPRPPLEAARRRAYQTLLRRGFSATVAYSAVRSWSEASSGSG